MNKKELLKQIKDQYWYYEGMSLEQLLHNAPNLLHIDFLEKVNALEEKTIEDLSEEALQYILDKQKESMELYYTPMSDDIFNEVKEKAIDIWKTYDNTYGYVDEKLERIKDLENIGDNAMYIISMFDHINKSKFIISLRLETIGELNKRLALGASLDQLVLKKVLNPYDISFDNK